MRRRRRSLASAASQQLASVHSSANNERVLTRRLLSQEADSDRDNDLSANSRETPDFLKGNWPQAMSFYVVFGVLVVSTVLLVVSVVFWARRQQESEQPC